MIAPRLPGYVIPSSNTGTTPMARPLPLHDDLKVMRASAQLVGMMEYLRELGAALTSSPDGADRDKLLAVIEDRWVKVGGITTERQPRLALVSTVDLTARAAADLQNREVEFARLVFESMCPAELPRNEPWLARFNTMLDDPTNAETFVRAVKKWPSRGGGSPSKYDLLAELATKLGVMTASSRMLKDDAAALSAHWKAHARR